MTQTQFCLQTRQIDAHYAIWSLIIDVFFSRILLIFYLTHRQGHEL